MIVRLQDLKVRDRVRGRNALREQRNDRKRLVCAYTGVELTLTGGPRDAEWDHVDPRNDPTNVAPAAAIVNRMKGEMTLEEFDDMIQALFEYRGAGRRPFNEDAFPSAWAPKSTATTRTPPVQP
jgi:hypothetical protein